MTDRAGAGPGTGATAPAGLALTASAYLVKPLPMVTASAPRLSAPVTADPAAVSKMPLSGRISVSAV
jgi:hypothetical protein